MLDSPAANDSKLFQPFCVSLGSTIIKHIFHSPLALSIFPSRFLSPSLSPFPCCHSVGDLPSLFSRVLAMLRWSYEIISFYFRSLLDTTQSDIIIAFRMAHDSLLKRFVPAWQRCENEKKFSMLPFSLHADVLAPLSWWKNVCASTLLGIFSSSLFF